MTTTSISPSVGAPVVNRPNTVAVGTIVWLGSEVMFFVVGQVFEYATLVSEGLTLSSDSYGSAFYLATGFHGIHVIAGLVAFLFIIGRAYAVKNFGHKEATSAIVVSYYWHFVDVVWVGLFCIIYILK